MYSPVRALLLGINLLVFALLVILGTPAVVAPVVATPITFIRNADYPSPPPQNTSTSILVKHVTPEDRKAKRDTLHSVDSIDTADHLSRRDVNTALGNLNLLNNYYQQMTQHATAFHSLSQSYSSSSSSEYESQSATEVSAFRSNLGGFQDLLAQLGTDKGLANYDKGDALETVLKNVVNANKDLLSTADEMVYELPAVGGTLGPLVYDIKCILDEILDAVENLTDAIINIDLIKSILQKLISDASQTVCHSGFAVVGLCILPEK